MSGKNQVDDAQHETSNSSSCGVSLDDLPESVLIHILSLLPMKDVVRTSVLSKDWEHKWTSVFCINITDWPKEEASIINCVNRILLQSQSIQSFHVSRRCMCVPTSFTRCLKTWIPTLSRRGIQSIEISYLSRTEFFIPPCLFDTTSLTSLKLKLSCVMKLPVTGYLCNLKFLSLSLVHLQNEYVSKTGKLQVMFPVVESLELIGCKWWGNVKLVEINAPALTTFNYYHCSARRANDFLIKICGSTLEKFQTSGVSSLTSLDLSTSSIVDAIFKDFNQICEHPIIGVSGSHSRISIHEFSGLKYLELRGRIDKFKPGTSLPKFDRLQKLELCIFYSVDAFVELLQMAPTLRQLVINEPLVKEANWEDLDFDKAEFVPSCMVSNLAEIKFSDFMCITRELNLVKFLLKNSLKLEKIIVSVHSKPLYSKADIEETLSSYPKGSPCISVVVT